MRRPLAFSVAAIAVATFWFAGSARAQYPSPSPSPSPSPVNFEGSLTINDNTATGCGFVPGSSVTVTIDGEVVGTAVVDEQGCATVVFGLNAGLTMDSCNVTPTTGLDSTGFARVSPGVQALGLVRAATSIPVPELGPGVHEICFIGPRAGGGTLTLCGSACVTAAGTVGGPSGGGGGLLPFTGADLAKWILIASVLLLVGSLLVVLARRRRARA